MQIDWQGMHDVVRLGALVAQVEEAYARPRFAMGQPGLQLLVGSTSFSRRADAWA